jgi:adenosylmethionine-8-amino-7-oxononanoate aminotransferase
LTADRAHIMSDALFPRSFRKIYPQAVRGEGCYIYTADGRRYLDAAGGAAVVTIGHGVKSVADAMARQAAELAYVHSSQFETPVAAELAERLLEMAPKGFAGGRVYLTSGGSEATETALKICRQYFLERGEKQRFRVVSRRQSYHGATLGALTVSGNVRRREPFAPLLREWGHIDPCYCYRCPLGLTYPDCKVACADELEKLLSGDETGTGAAGAAGSVAGFIVEPVSGATLGAVSPPDGYLQRIAEICRQHGILLIADEVLTGMGRTGKNFAVQHWGVEPDLILVGKGIASGYAPLGAVLVAKRVVEALEKGSGALLHGFTYNAHPVAAAAGAAVSDFARREKLYEGVAGRGEELRGALEEAAKEFGCVGDIRGMGLLWGVEFVADATSGEPFAPELQFSGRVAAKMLEEGVLSYPMQGSVDGWRGDHLMLAPPYVITSEQIGELARALRLALAAVSSEVQAQASRIS